MTASTSAEVSSATETATATAVDNSEKIESVYPEIREFYRKNPSLEYRPSALDRTCKIFKVTTEGNEITKRIDAIFRVKPADKEFVYYNQQWTGTDYLGNTVDWGYIEGKVEVPKAHFEFVPDEAKILATSIERTNTLYNIEYNEKNLKEILPQLHNTTQYIVDTGNRLYTVTRDSFFNDGFDDAVEFGATGRRVRENERQQ